MNEHEVTFRQHVHPTSDIYFSISKLCILSCLLLVSATRIISSRPFPFPLTSSRAWIGPACPPRIVAVPFPCGSDRIGIDRFRSSVGQAQSQPTTPTTLRLASSGHWVARCLRYHVRGRTYYLFLLSLHAPDIGRSTSRFS